MDCDAAAVAAGHVLEGNHETVILVLGPAPADRRRDDVAILVLVLADTPTRTEVLAGMITMEDEDERLRRIEHRRLAIQGETTKVVRAEVEDHRRRAIRFLDRRETIGAESLLAVLDATGRVQLGILTGELVASCRTEIEPVFLVLRPDRVAAAVIVGNTSDLEGAVGLGLVAAEDALLAPVVEAV